MPTGLSAITLEVTGMAASKAFYAALGFDDVAHEQASFISYAIGEGFLNLQLVDRVPETRWGRFIVHVDDVDAVYDAALAAGIEPEMAPSDAPWGERYFHLRDPDGHEISIAKPLD